jgi:hypothetical protein
MSYELADGSMSTDYKIGDEFTHEREGRIFRLGEEDGTRNPWFTDRDGGNRYARHWEDLTPVLTKQGILINQIRETIKQLKATIKELES